MTEPSIAVSRVIPAPVGRIFAILSRPTNHPGVDGSGMVRSATADVTISKVGDKFAINMFNDEVRDYVMENTVVEFEPNRRLVWEPVMVSTDNPQFQSDLGDSANYQWGWELEPTDADHTRVTEFFDCTRSPTWLHEATSEGESWRPAIEASLENLERMVAEG